jgi:protein TonB
MESKKTEKYDVESKRGLHFWIGLSISLLLVISAFEWKSEYDTEILKNPVVVDLIDELVFITEHEPPERPKPKVVAPILIEVENDKIIDPPDITFDPDDLIEIDDISPGDDIEDTIEDIVWTGIVESMPKPANGYKDFYAFVGKNLKYPSKAQRMGVEGKIFIQFIIDKQGNITELEVIRGIGMGCDEEALRVMKLAPKWQAGKQRGKPVRVRMVLPITFKLR